MSILFNGKPSSFAYSSNWKLLVVLNSYMKKKISYIGYNNYTLTNYSTAQLFEATNWRILPIDQQKKINKPSRVIVSRIRSQMLSIFNSVAAIKTIKNAMHFYVG